MKNVADYISRQVSKAIKGMNWNGSGIKKIQEMFTKGEINRYNIVDVLDSFNHKKDKDGNIINQTELGDS